MTKGGWGSFAYIGSKKMGGIQSTSSGARVPRVPSKSVFQGALAASLAKHEDTVLCIGVGTMGALGARAPPNDLA